MRGKSKISQMIHKGVNRPSLFPLNVVFVEKIWINGNPAGIALSNSSSIEICGIVAFVADNTATPYLRSFGFFRGSRFSCADIQSFCKPKYRGSGTTKRAGVPSRATTTWLRCVPNSSHSCSSSGNGLGLSLLIMLPTVDGAARSSNSNAFAFLT